MRYQRLEALIGQEKLDFLKTQHVMVFGLGGVGAYAAEALARSGVGTLTIIDGDRIELSNINRQLIALESTLGAYKTDVMAMRIHDIDPSITVHPVNEWVESGRIHPFFMSRVDYVVDAIDMVSVKMDLIAYCVDQQVPLISSMGLANKFYPERVQLSTLAETQVCPLAKALRTRLRQRGVRLDFPVVYSSETPMSPRGATLGSTAFVPSVGGLMMAAKVVRDLLGL
jgi:tRNA A37 threonylcarbamoyladenosine dehydratase